MGKSEKKPNDSEIKFMKDLVRRSIVLVKDLPAGHILEEADLEAKRPGDGISPSEYEKFLGKKLNRGLRKDDQITFADID